MLDVYLVKRDASLGDLMNSRVRRCLFFGAKSIRRDADQIRKKDVEPARLDTVN